MSEALALPAQARRLGLRFQAVRERESTFVQSLRKGNIPIYSHKTVATHMRRMQNRMRAPRMHALVDAVGHLITIALGIGICYLVALAAGVSFASVSPRFVALCAGLGAGIYLLLRVACAPNAKRYAEWEKTSFSDYVNSRRGRSTPPQIRERAEALTALVLREQIEVHYLYEDPFIAVVENGERVFVGVWDEKGYIG